MSLLLLSALCSLVSSISIKQFYQDTGQFTLNDFRDRYAEKLEILLRNRSSYNSKIIEVGRICED